MEDEDLNKLLDNLPFFIQLNLLKKKKARGTNPQTSLSGDSKF